MDYQNITFKPKEFKKIDQTFIDRQIASVKINVPDDTINYGDFDTHYLDDVADNNYLLKPINSFNNSQYKNLLINVNEPQFSKFKMNIDPIIDSLQPLEYKGIRMNYLGNIYDKKSQLTPINSLPRIDYKKDKFTL